MMAILQEKPGTKATFRTKGDEMMPDNAETVPEGERPAETVPVKPLSPAAQRALAEAQDRRDALDAKRAELARTREINGRGGLDPARYDDWEVKGLASDF